MCIPLCEPIIEMIVSKNIDYFLLRELLYNLLTYNINIHESFYFILNRLLNMNYMSTYDIEKVMPKFI